MTEPLDFARSLGAALAADAAGFSAALRRDRQALEQLEDEQRSAAVFRRVRQAGRSELHLMVAQTRRRRDAAARKRGLGRAQRQAAIGACGLVLALALDELAARDRFPHRND